MKTVINNLSEKDIILEMMNHPTTDEIQKIIKEILEKDQVLTVFPLRSYSVGGNKLATLIYHLIWLVAPVPQEWFDVTLISLFKGKGSKSVEITEV